MERSLSILAASLVAIWLSACTPERAYYSAQAWRQNQCQRIADKAEFDRCMNDASMSYETYKRETGSGQQK